MMRNKFTSALAIAAILLTLLLPTRRAEADIGVWGWVGIGVASYAVFVLAATAYIYRNPAPFAADDARLPEREDRRGDTIQLGAKCRQNGEPGMVLACW